MIHVLQRLFEQRFHSLPARIEALQGELGGVGAEILSGWPATRSAPLGFCTGCTRRMSRSGILKHFRKNGLPVPEIYAEDLEHGAYLEEDFGDTTLFEFLSKHREGEKIAPAAVEAYRKVVAVLPRFQIEAGRDLDYSVCYPRGSFDRQSIAWDLNYFKYYFLRLAGISFNEQALEDDFDNLTNFLLSADRDYFMYRDFQSRNIMLQTPSHFFWIIKVGAKARSSTTSLPCSTTLRLICHRNCGWNCSICISRRPAILSKINREEFLHYFYAYVYVRILQALGAYGFRGFYERKAHFLQSVPYALKNVRWLLHHVKLPIALPALMEAFHSMLASEKLQGLASEADNLTVRILSFSFHRGLPKDESGHGGGFVFDGRSLPNPGREEQFKTLTGKDAPVIDYLNREESVHQFLASVMSLVDASVNNYQRRGFKSLMVSFGCTGGQHRSVFLAEQLAKRLRGRNGVEVVVRHRELETSIGQARGSKLCRANEGDDSGGGIGDAIAAADQRSSEGAGGGCRTNAAGDYAGAVAQVWDSAK